MDKIHQRVLIQCVTWLKDELIVSEVLSHLLKDGILTCDLKQEVQAEKTDSSKATTLLSILAKRGPNAYSSFLNATSATGQYHITTYLQDMEKDIKEGIALDGKSVIILS